MVRATVPNAVIVVGGPHLSIYPKESLSWDCFDIACVGDGEDTFLKSVSAAWIRMDRYFKPMHDFQMEMLSKTHHVH